MTTVLQLKPQSPNRGRPTKFTPERIAQVRNLVERGKSRDEIAEIIGVTTGSLQVTCSKLGISLRRPTVDMGTGVLWRRQPRYQKNESTSDPAHSRRRVELGAYQRDREAEKRWLGPHRLQTVGIGN